MAYCKPQAKVFLTNTYRQTHTDTYISENLHIQAFLCIHTYIQIYMCTYVCALKKGIDITYANDYAIIITKATTRKTHEQSKCRSTATLNFNDANIFHHRWRQSQAVLTSQRQLERYYECYCFYCSALTYIRTYIHTYRHVHTF